MKNALSWSAKSAPDDYLIALGAVTLRFNSLEWHHILLHQIISREPPGITKFRFSKLDNSMRLQILKSLAKECGVGPTGMGLIEGFCSGYEACAHNRNVLSHARIADFTPVALGDALRATKPNKKGEELTFVFSTPIVQRVADEIDNWKGFTRLLAAWLLDQTNGSRALPLPDIPPVPLRMEGSQHKDPTKPAFPPVPWTQ
jgi:hypothetical protein